MTRNGTVESVSLIVAMNSKMNTRISGSVKIKLYRMIDMMKTKYRRTMMHFVDAFGKWF